MVNKEDIKMTIKIYCDICGKECKDQYTSGLGEYCDNCVKKIKAHIKGLKLEQQPKGYEKAKKALDKLGKFPKSWGRDYEY